MPSDHRFQYGSPYRSGKDSKQGLVTAVTPLLGTLRSLGYWVSDEVVAVVKNLAGE
jgi:hypothetical protein